VNVWAVIDRRNGGYRVRFYTRAVGQPHILWLECSGSWPSVREEVVATLRAVQRSSTRLGPFEDSQGSLADWR
jgi:hypothetical protein